MTHLVFRSRAVRWKAAVIAALLCLTACAPAARSLPASATPELRRVLTPLLLPTPTRFQDAFSDIPNEARIANRSGDPRPPAYWMVWNTCAEDNRAEVAAANGGRAAGFILMDDLLLKPGIQLGDYPVNTCPAGLALLQGQTAAGEVTQDALYALASALLAAELNLGAGAETCPIADEAVVGGHMVLSSAGFNGSGGYALTEELAQAVPRLVALLAGYNRGELCR